MSDLMMRFKTATKEVQHLPQRPDNDTLLKLYALYKQGMKGDDRGKRPGMFDMFGRAKYDAWAELEGMAEEDAQQAYVEMVDTLKGA